MQVIDILKTAKAKIEKPENWCKGEFEKSYDGSVKFCALGALYSAVDEKDVPIRLGNLAEKGLRDACERITGERLLVQYNDSPERTHEEIMTVYDVAIRLAESWD